MIGVNLKTTVNASAEELWRVVGDFNGLPKFVAAATTSRVEGEGVGAVRTLILPDGATILERLEELDESGKKLVYSIVEGPLPVENYLSTMKVTDLGGGKSELSWSSKFNPSGASDDEAVAAIEGIYRMGFEGLAKLFG